MKKIRFPFKSKFYPEFSRLAVGLFDVTILVLLGIWLNGGIWFQNHHYLRHGADPRRAAIILAAIGYLYSELRSKSLVLRAGKKAISLLEKALFRWICVFLCMGGAIALAVQQSLALRSTLYDVGIFHQILWSLSHGFGFNSTISGAGDFLLDHFSPSLVLLVPSFQIFEDSPLFLPVVQAILLFGGASAWIYLASRLPFSTQEFREKLAAATTVFILGFDSLWGNLRWGFHENAIAFASLSWAIACLLTRNRSESVMNACMNRSRIFTLFIIAAFSKEILLLDVGLMLICWAALEYLERDRTRSTHSTHPAHLKDRGAGGEEQKKYWLGKARTAWICFLSLSAVGLFYLFVQFEATPHPSDKNYFNRYYSYLGQNLGEFGKNLIYSPGSVIRAVGGKELVKYFFTVFGPFLFLPLALPYFLKKKWDALPKNIRKMMVTPWIIGLLPSLGSAALATYPPLRGSNFHYVLELWPVLASLTLFALAILRSEKLIWIWALLSLVRMDFDPIGEYREFWRESQINSAVRAKLSEIPLTEAVVADEVAGTWVSGRRWVTRWPDTALLPDQCPSLIVVRNASANSLTQMGVRTLISRCESVSKVPEINSDLIAPTPLWKIGDWVAYSVRAKK